MGLETVLEPVGPLPAGVYWRRRGISAVIVLLLLLLGFKACSGGGGGGRAGLSATTGASVSPSAVTPSATTSTSPSPAADTATTPCADTQLSLAVTSDATRYPSGAPVQLALKITNTGATACSKDLSMAQRGFVITSGNTRIWSSTDCQSPKPAVKTLQPGKVESLVLSWNRHWSDTACSTATTARIATPGTYVVKAVLGTSLSKAGPVIVLTS